MSDKRKCGLLYERDFHHLDHIAPLCALEKMPLIVTDKEVEALAKKYYPDVQTTQTSPLQLGFYLLSSFNTLVSTLTRPQLSSILFASEELFGKKIDTVWLPHGHSDKGNYEGLKHETNILVYGPKMIDELLACNINCSTRSLGNYRRRYYQDKLVPIEKNLILFAPTWNDYEGPSTFFTALPEIVKRLDNHSLIIKPHPNLIKQTPNAFMRLKCETSPQIYPLLSRAAIYVGDTSSIAYDMLTFQRPMYFLNHKQQTLPIHSAGFVLKKGEYDPIFNEASPPYDEIRSLYHYTFGEPL